MRKYIIFLLPLCIVFFIYAATQLCTHFHKLKVTSLELPDGSPEILVTLSGKLRLNLCSIENDPPMYCWFLQMDGPSFKIASTTPVWGYALSLDDILTMPNWFEVQLGRDKETEHFCSRHVNQQVTVKGFLFHAHTGHHHAPFLMNLKEIYQEEDGAKVVQ